MTIEEQIQAGNAFTIAMIQIMEREMITRQLTSKIALMTFKEEFAIAFQAIMEKKIDKA